MSTVEIKSTWSLTPGHVLQHVHSIYTVSLKQPVISKTSKITIHNYSYLNKLK